MAHARPCGWIKKGCPMSLLKTLKGQILVLSALCMVAALLVLTLVNYFSARGQAQERIAQLAPIGLGGLFQQQFDKGIVHAFMHVNPLHRIADLPPKHPKGLSDPEGQP